MIYVKSYLRQTYATWLNIKEQSKLIQLLKDTSSIIAKDLLLKNKWNSIAIRYRTQINWHHITRRVSNELGFNLQPSVSNIIPISIRFDNQRRVAIVSRAPPLLPVTWSRWFECGVRDQGCLDSYISVSSEVWLWCKWWY